MDKTKGMKIALKYRDRWIEFEHVEGNKHKALTRFLVYTLHHKRLGYVPDGFITDFRTGPEFLDNILIQKSIAFVIHDWLYQNQICSRKEADRIQDYWLKQDPNFTWLEAKDNLPSSPSVWWGLLEEISEIMKLFLFKYFILPFKDDDFIRKDTLTRRLTYLTRQIAQHDPEDDRKALKSERDTFYDIWCNYHKRHREHRRKWKKKMLDDFKKQNL